MGETGKVTKPKIMVTKTEVFLLSITALFLAILAAMVILPERESGSYTVTTQRRTVKAEEETEWRIDLNTAGAEELQRLEGIGPVLAERIVTYREEHGGFTDVEQLLEVEGIGDKVLDGMRDMLTIEEEP